MKLIGYKGTSKGLAGLVDILIRFRLKGKHSHTEILFEPGDGVGHLVPDGILEPIDGKYWCGSSSGMDRIPFYSSKRPNKLGGVRFKRIAIDQNKWDVIDVSDRDAVKAAVVFVNREGSHYDYRLILSYLSFFVKEKEDQLVCSEICALALGLKESWRYDPCLLMLAMSK